MMEPINRTIAERIKSNWDAIVQSVTLAAEQASRSMDEITIVGVSKYVDAETTLALWQSGCQHLGENRPQALWQKAESLRELKLDPSTEPNWHMIGHVQTNKLRRMMRYRPLIHSVDSERLLRAIEEEAARQDITMRVLLEVNISGDKDKTGLSPEQVKQCLSIAPLAHVSIEGLMAMAGWGTDSEEALRQFHKVASLKDQLQQESGLALPELSMGMTGDFPQAIAAGATMVRIGSALFEGVR